MTTYAFLRLPADGMMEVVTLTHELKAVVPAVVSCTATHTTEPYVVFVNAERRLTEEERVAVESVLRAHRAA